MVLDIRTEEQKRGDYTKPSRDSMIKEINIWKESPSLVSSKTVDLPEARWNPSIHKLDLFEQILHISVSNEKSKIAYTFYSKASEKSKL